MFIAVDESRVEVFKWTYENEYFMWSNESQIAMGGGGDGFGFVIDPDFQFGETSPCCTFRNPHLTKTQNGRFRIMNVEVWGFPNSMKNRKVADINNVNSKYGDGDKYGRLNKDTSNYFK